MDIEDGRTISPAGNANSRQACSLLLLTATLIGSCVALAIRTLIESGSALLLMVLMMGFIAASVSVLTSLTRRYLHSRREEGHTSACFGCILLEPLEAWPPVGTMGELAAARTSGVSSAHREQMELSVRSALSALPEQPFMSEVRARFALRCHAACGAHSVAPFLSSVGALYFFFAFGRARH